MAPEKSAEADPSSANNNPPAAILAQAAEIAAGNAEDDEQPQSSTHARRSRPTHEAGASAAGNERHSAGPSSRRHHAATEHTSESQRHADEHIADANPPPSYGEHLDSLDVSQNGLDTSAKIASDGRVEININQKTKAFSNLLIPALRSHLTPQQEPEAPPPGYIPPSLAGEPGQAPPPPLNIAIHVVGSRGDVQPFVSLGLVLKNKYGHRVRIATHPTFQQFIEENGLEFFSIGGDPAELMAFMVKNPGLMPGFDAMRNGDVGKRRKGIYDILKGCWRSCIEAGDGTGAPANDETVEDYASIDSGISLGGDPSVKPFVADAIIANPPSFAHVHIAEKMGIPLHMMFTMPWSPTQAFPHPLANIQSSNADNGMTNFVSYALVEMMTWQGLGDLINKFRERTLGIESISLLWAPGMATRLRVPFTYCWSPALIAKPKDWGPHVSIAGFYFLSLASSYQPDPSLAEFLDNGPPPVYIGFGSIVVDDPNALTKMIFEAVKKTGVRALVSKGWGGIGADDLGIPDNVYMLGNVPHDWLFKRVSCVVHHGGAGTTAAGMALGKPTVVVPFFGDQPFWGAMIARAGAGPRPVPYKELTADILANAIQEALKPAALEKAAELGSKIGSESGAENGATIFHDKLDVDKLRCSLAPSRVAVWRVKRTKVRLSALAATVLGNEGLLDFNDLKIYRACEYATEDTPWDPISGGATALLGTMGSMMMGVADFPVELFKLLSGNSDKKTKERKAKEKEKEKSNASGGSPADSQSLQSISSRPSLQSGAGSSLSMDTNGSGAGDAAEPHPNETASGALSQQVSLADQERSSREPAPPAGSRTPVEGHHGEPHHRSLSGLMHHSRSRSVSRDRSTTPSGNNRKPLDQSGQVPQQVSLETALGASKGVGRIVEAGLKSPMDFTLGLARGFHNAPKLYGDKTVRKEDRVTGFQSGLKAAGKEFGFGMYDGISGIVTQPLKGAKKEGAAGFVKGFAKGIGGIILKPPAAFWSLPGYAFKGVYKELQKHFGSNVLNYIIAARSAQGYEDWQKSTAEERKDIIVRWHGLQDEITKAKRTFGENVHGNLAEFHAKHGLSSRDVHKATNHKENRKNTPRVGSSDASPAQTPGAQRAQTMPGTLPQEEGPEDFEEAIRTSVASTSTGDPEQDKVIERAIRASVKELLNARHSNVDEHELFERAIQASVREAGREQSQNAGSTQEHDEALERALQQGLQLNPAYTQRHEGSQEHDSGIDTDDDEAYRKALEESKDPKHHGGVAGHDDEEVQKAVEASQHAFSAQERDDAKSKAEEDVVLEYIKKQSLAEEEHRKLAEARKGKESEGAADEHDEEIKRAIEESLKGHEPAGESSGT